MRGEFVQRAPVKSSPPEVEPPYPDIRPENQLRDTLDIASVESASFINGVDALLEEVEATSFKTRLLLGNTGLQDSKQTEPEYTTREEVGNTNTVEAAFPEQWRVANERNVRIMGRAALILDGQERTTGSEKKKSLSNLFRASYEGDKSAKKAINTDCVYDVREKVCKSGAKMTTTAEIVDGEITQHGRTTEERQFNTRINFTHQFSGLSEMNTAEGQTAFTIEEGVKSGQLKEGDSIVECSLVPAKEHEQIKGAGLFLREMIAIIRVTTIGKNEVTIDSYLVAGTDQRKLSPVDLAKTEADEEQIEKQAMANRFDIAVFRELLSELGVKDTDKMSPEDMLASPLYFRRSEDGESKDGLDITMAYDRIVGKRIGTPVMMGRADLYDEIVGENHRPLTRNDYEEHFGRVHKLQEDIKPVGEKVARNCAARWQEVEGDDYKAGRLMHKLSEEAVVKYMADRLAAQVSKADTYDGVELPDMTVMGVATYNNLLEYHSYLMAGDLQKAQGAFLSAVQNAKGTGCPTGLRSSKLGTKVDSTSVATGLEDLNLEVGGEESSIDNEGDSESDGIPSVINCIKCRKPSRKEEVVKEDCWKCPKCNHKVDVCTGKVLNQGKADVEPEEPEDDWAEALKKEFTLAA